MSNISPEGEARLLTVIEWLERGAPQEKGVSGFDMDVGVRHDDCGTVCCIAGAVCQFNEPFRGDGKLGLEEHWTSVFASATHLLGISYKTAEELFRQSRINDHITPAIAATTLRHFLATGTVEWPDSADDW